MRRRLKIDWLAEIVAGLASAWRELPPGRAKFVVALMPVLLVGAGLWAVGRWLWAWAFG